MIMCYRVLSFEEKLKDTTTSYEGQLQAAEKKHRDAIVSYVCVCVLYCMYMYMCVKSLTLFQL